MLDITQEIGKSSPRGYSLAVGCAKDELLMPEHGSVPQSVPTISECGEEDNTHSHFNASELPLPPVDEPSSETMDVDEALNATSMETFETEQIQDKEKETRVDTKSGDSDFIIPSLLPPPPFFDEISKCNSQQSCDPDKTTVPVLSSDKDNVMTPTTEECVQPIPPPVQFQDCEDESFKDSHPGPVRNMEELKTNDFSDMESNETNQTNKGSSEEDEIKVAEANVVAVKTEPEACTSSEQSTSSIEPEGTVKVQQRKRYRIPLRTVKFLFGRCEVKLWRCDDLIVGKRKRPGPKSKTVQFSDTCETIDGPGTTNRGRWRAGPKSKKKQQLHQRRYVKVPGPKSKTRKVKKTKDDEDFDPNIPNPLSRRKDPPQKGNKIFKCPKCEDTFTHHVAYLGHLNSHRGRNFLKQKDWKYSCPTCGKKCQNSQAMKVHVRVHTGERPYVCRVCGNRYITISNLNSHMRQHTGEKPYECQYCGRKFTHSANLKFHLSDRCTKKDD